MDKQQDHVAELEGLLASRECDTFTTAESNAIRAAISALTVDEAIQALATGTYSVEIYGPGNHGGSLDWLVGVCEAETDSVNEYEGATLHSALQAAIQGESRE